MRTTISRRPDFDDRHDVTPRREALDAFSQLRVDLVLGGHLHRSYIGNSLDLYPGQDREHGVMIVQAGTATSRGGERERKNSFNLIEVGIDQMRVTHYMFFQEHGGFAPFSRHVFPRVDRACFWPSRTRSIARRNKSRRQRLTTASRETPLEMDLQVGQGLLEHAQLLRP